MHERRNIIVMCASFGAVTAIGHLARNWSSKLDAAILIAFDGGLQPPSTVLHTLQHYVPFPVRYAADGERIQAGRMYLSPPEQHMRVGPQGVVQLENVGLFSRGPCPSADLLFSSAAKVFGRRVIGVVLTGSTSDGTRGLHEISQAGGIGIVQDPAEASDRTMPDSALRGDSPDYCVTIERMAPLISALVEGLTPPREA